MNECSVLYGELLSISYDQVSKKIKYKFRDINTMYHIKLYKECDTYNNYIMIRKNINNYYFKIKYNKEGEIITMDQLEVNCNCIII